MLFNAEKLNELLAFKPEEISKEAALKVQLLSFYRYIFQEQPCGGCKDSLTSYYIKLKNEGMAKLMNKVERDFDFKDNVCVQVKFGAADHYTNHNLTNDVAIALLKVNAKRIRLFKRFPANWEELISDPEPQPEPIEGKTEPIKSVPKKAPIKRKSKK
jgi:hypothetical protein